MERARRPATTAAAVADAYSATGAAWSAGPARVYRRLAEELVRRCPGGVAGVTVVDVGAGTGAAGRAALAAGAERVVPVDVAVGMLRAAGLAGVAGDAVALPFAAARFGAAVAAFSLNHLAEPAAGLREVARVVLAGGGIVAGAYADDDDHPAKAAVDEAAAARGWLPPDWYRWIRRHAVPQLATVGGAGAALAAAGLTGTVERVRVPVEIDADGMVAWRLGMAQLAPFVAALPSGERARLVDDARRRLGTPPPLVRSIVVVAAIAGPPPP